MALLAAKPEPKPAGFKAGDKVKFLIAIDADDIKITPGQYGFVHRDSDEMFVFVNRKGKILVCRFGEISKCRS